MMSTRCMLQLLAALALCKTCRPNVTNQEDSILHQIFASQGESGVPRHALELAWERHPLLSKIQTGVGEGEDDRDIPTVSSAATATEREARTSFFSSIFSFDALGTLLSSDPQLDHGTDYKMLKKIWKDGEEWSGILPLSGVLSPDQVVHAITVGKFSLVVDALQRRWTAVNRLTRALERQLPAHFSPDADIPISYVSCNLYLTPEPETSDLQKDPSSSVSGFEVHWDWMDVIVLQISGSKRWTVASEPFVALSTPDLKRKPSLREVHSVSYYNDFLLRPGDALYIPRGFMHNASVTGEDTQPSLHLTFGVEHACYTTLEALVQVALHLFDLFLQQRECEADGQADEETCSDDYSTPWEKVVLHYGISEVSRRDVLEKGDEISFSADDDLALLQQRAGPFLRRSMLSFAVSPPETATTTTSGKSKLSAAYVQALEYVKKLSTLEKAATFASFNRQLFENPDAAEASTSPTSYCYIAMPDDGPPSLEEMQAVTSQPNAAQRYTAFLSEFASFARANFERAMESANSFNYMHRDDTRVRDDQHLLRVGQSK